MKRIFTGMMLVMLAVSCGRREKDVFLFSYFTDNGQDGLHLAYSYDGLHWEALNGGRTILRPVVGKDSLMRDPMILCGSDGFYHMVWTTGWTDQHIGYAASRDLIHWSPQRLIRVMEHESESRNCWAPEIFYDRNSDLYYIFWATTIPGRHSDIQQADDGKTHNHRMYYVTTRDFETFSETGMFFNPDFSVIDAAVMGDGNRTVMFLKNENPAPPEKNIRVTISNGSVLDFPTAVSAPITGDYWAEGPSPLRVRDSVYVYFDKYRERKYGAVRSKDLVHWDDVSENVFFPQGTRHGSAFTVGESVLENLFGAFPE
ncbi:MAG: glycoside hydrolase family 43 protein [Rikenellaceae bacterium]|nr:glycoside hydrolase family 43 protein [Rikenellaceae bacterium]